MKSKRIDLWSCSPDRLMGLFLTGAISKQTYLAIAIGHQNEVEPDWGLHGRYIPIPKSKSQS